MNLLEEINKNGFVVVNDVGLDDPNKSLTEHLETFARPIAYMGLPMIMDLKPQPGYQPASFAGTGKFDMHTDLSWYNNPPPYIGMFCVNMESAGGGIPLLADSWHILDQMDDGDRKFLETYPISFPSPDHIDHDPFISPIATEKDGKIMLRFRYDLLDDPPAPVTRFFNKINENLIRVPVKAGSLFIFDNLRMLHGRTQLIADMASDRHFKRIYGEYPA